MTIEAQELKPTKLVDGSGTTPVQDNDKDSRQNNRTDNTAPLISNQQNRNKSQLDNRDTDNTNTAKNISNSNALLKGQYLSSKQATNDDYQIGGKNNSSHGGIFKAIANNNEADQSATRIQASPVVFVATFGALLGALSMGFALGYTAPAFFDMEKNMNSSKSDNILDPDYNKRESQKSLIGSTLAVGALVAALASEPCNNLFGRRIPLICCGIPFVIGWLLLTFANQLSFLVLGRLIIGACCGIACGTAPTYVVEIAPPQIRGALGTCFQLMVVIGNLLSSILGMFLPWRTLAAVSLIPGIGMTTMMLFLPESPSWLVDKQRRDDARNALKRLRNGSIEQEFDELVQAKMRQQQESSGSAYSCDTLRSTEFLKPLGFGLGLMFFQQFTGINAILMYQSDIFKKASPDSDALLCTVWVCLAQVIATLVCNLFVDRLGRRPLLWTSGAGCMLALLSLGAHSYIAINNEAYQKDFAMVPLVSLILFITFFSFGFGPIPWMMIPELATSHVRSLIGSFGALFAWTGAYILTASMKPLFSLVGDAWTYWILAIICAISILFIVILPETKAKTTNSTPRTDDHEA